MKSDLQKKAVALREQGKSYGEISAALGGISKGTLSYWLKNIPLSRPSPELPAVSAAGLNGLTLGTMSQ